MLCLNKLVNIISMPQLSISILKGESGIPDSPRWLLLQTRLGSRQIGHPQKSVETAPKNAEYSDRSVLCFLNSFSERSPDVSETSFSPTLCQRFMSKDYRGVIQLLYNLFIRTKDVKFDIFT